MQREVVYAVGDLVTFDFNNGVRILHGAGRITDRGVAGVYVEISTCNEAPDLAGRVVYMIDSYITSDKHQLLQSKYKLVREAETLHHTICMKLYNVQDYYYGMRLVHAAARAQERITRRYYKYVLESL